jgi:hypothetical protein
MAHTPVVGTLYHETQLERTQRGSLVAANYCLIIQPFLGIIERLKMFSFPVRYCVYVAGVILLFLVALGVGATAAAVVGWQAGQTATDDAGTDRAGTSTSEGSMLEATSTAGALKEAGITPSDDPSGRVDGVGETVFTHRATDDNSRGDYTYITNPEIDGDSDAVVLVSPDTNRGSAYAHNIGVWYTPVAHKWAIFNQDLSAVPAGSTFEVVVPATSTGFVHQADPANSAGSYTYLDSRLTNGQPDAVLQVTQNWNPGGGSGVYNNHPTGVIYDSRQNQWAIYNRDGARLPRGAAFNVAVSEGVNSPSG